MRIFQQLAADQAGNILGITDFFPHIRQHRLQIKELNRIAAMDHRRNRGHDQLQAIREAVAGNLALVQLQLVQNGFKALLADALFHHLGQRLFQQRFKVALLVRVTALNATHKGHFTVGVLKAAHGGWRLPDVGRFQRPHQGRRTVFQ